MRLDKNNLIELLAERLKLSPNIVGLVVDELPNLIYETLAENGEVRIQGFGRFYTTRQARRLVVNLNHLTKKKIAIEPMLIPRFTAGMTFKKQIRKPK